MIPADLISDFAFSAFFSLLSSSLSLESETTFFTASLVAEIAFLVVQATLFDREDIFFPVRFNFSNNGETESSSGMYLGKRHRMSNLLSFICGGSVQI